MSDNFIERQLEDVQLGTKQTRGLPLVELRPDLTEELDRIAGPYRHPVNERELRERREALMAYFDEVSGDPKPYDWANDPYMNDQYSEADQAWLDSLGETQGD